MKIVSGRSSNTQSLPLPRSPISLINSNSRLNHNGANAMVPKPASVQGLDRQLHLHSKFASYSCRRRGIIANAGNVRVYYMGP